MARRLRKGWSEGLALELVVWGLGGLDFGGLAGARESKEVGVVEAS